jgi:signal peptidase I
MSRTARRQAVFVVVFLIVVCLFMTTFRMGVVHGQSMEPTYQDGQVVLVRRRNRWSAPLHRNDIVLLRKDRDIIIKRVYRLSGEEIDRAFPDVRDTLPYSGQGVYYEQQVTRTNHGMETRYFVPEGYLVVLGDNLRVSEDSRVFGPVPEQDVLGVVVNAQGPPYADAAPVPPPGTPAHRASFDRRASMPPR